MLRESGQGVGIVVSKDPKETNASYSLREPSEVQSSHQYHIHSIGLLLYVLTDFPGSIFIGYALLAAVGRVEAKCTPSKRLDTLNN